MAYKERISVNIDRVEYEQLRRVARENDVSIAWIARRALKDFLARSDLRLELSAAAAAPATEDDTK